MDPLSPAAPPGLPDRTAIQQVARLGAVVRENISRVIVGKTDVIDRVLVALLCGGHVLLEDVPGLGKTLLARSLAKSLACSFARLQFTPDLLPSDVTGLSVYNQQAQDFQFRAGPIFNQVVLADEINRATPRTQSALLEAMEEGTTTVDGQTRALPTPFLVLATQNPIELEGTFPLPEAQLDRFLVRLSIGYPEEAEEDAILTRFQHHSPLADLQPVARPADLLAAQAAVRTVEVQPDVRRYILALVRGTRGNPALELGASPRGSLALYRTAQAYAALQGRPAVLPDDVKALAPAVLPHRLILNPEARLRNRNVAQLVTELLATTPVPVEPAKAER